MNGFILAPLPAIRFSQVESDLRFSKSTFYGAAAFIGGVSIYCQEEFASNTVYILSTD
jgi:hypothetical protein